MSEIIPEGFVPHDGGDCPVPKYSRVRVKGRGSDGRLEEWSGGALHFDWSIVFAYQVVVLCEMTLEQQKVRAAFSGVPIWRYGYPSVAITNVPTE